MNQHLLSGISSLHVFTTTTLYTIRNRMSHLRCDFIAPRSAFCIIDLFNFNIDINFKRDAMLPRTYDEMQTMASAHRMTIAWP